MSIQKLAGQTMWYGVSSIAARFLNYLLTPYLTAVLTKADYGKMSIVYSALPVLNILFTYGLETAYFRFSNKTESKENVYNTIATSIIISTLLFGFTLLCFHKSLANIAGLSNYPEFIRLSIIIIMLDTFSVIPFAKLRNDSKPRKYAFLKLMGILVNIFFTFFFLSFCKHAVEADANSFFNNFYNPAQNPVYYIIVANLIQAAVTLLLLTKEVSQIKLKIDKKLWVQILIYTAPLIIAGLGGMINETFDRLMLRWWVPGTITFKEEQVGIYSACYKLSILITLFVQAFRMGAEPFFFKNASTGNAQATYARVMKYFVIVLSIMFLVVMLYMPIWKHFINKKEWEGLAVVPILLLANMFLGIYYSLSIWYKLGNKTIAGAYITLIGAALTLVINFIFIPTHSYIACAWATFICYGSMMCISYLWGQKEYAIPYNWKRLVLFISLAVVFFLVHQAIMTKFEGNVLSIFIGSIFIIAYISILFFLEKEELKSLPVVGKYFSRF